MSSVRWEPATQKRLLGTIVSEGPTVHGLLKAADLDKAADIAVQNPYYNPRPITREGIRALLQDAFEGRRPTA